MPFIPSILPHRPGLSTRVAALVPALLAAAGLQATVEPAPPQGVSWHPSSRTFDAHVAHWRVPRILEAVVQATGWEVYVDTNLSATVSSRFRSLHTQDALRRLLPDINFSLIARSNAPTRLYVFQGSIQDAHTRVASPSDTRADRRILNELIVRLAPGSKANIQQIADRIGAVVVGKVEDLNAYRLRFPDEAAAESARLALADSPDLRGIEANFALRNPELPQSGSAQIPGLNLKPAGASADGQIVVALLDTAVASDDPALAGFLLPQLSTAEHPASASASDPITHGTAMADTLLRSLASQATDQGESRVRILPVDVYGGSDLTTTFDIVRGLYAAAAGGADIINLSLAGDGDSPLLHEAIRALRSQNVLIFAASGNEPTTALTFPAAYPEVAAVTAADRSGQVADYANRGGFVDLLAPGTSIVESGGRAYLVSGTSAATARVSGLAAGLLEAGNATPNQVLAALLNALQFTPPGASPADATAPSGAPASR